VDIANLRFELAGYSITGTVVLAAAGALTVLAATVAVLRASRRRRAAAAAQAEAVAHHERMVAAYRDSVAAWHRRRDEFRGLLETARTGGTATAPQGVELQKGERVHLTTTARLLGKDGAPDDAGLLAVTSRRLVLAGSTTHVWDLDAVAQVRHVGADRTMLRPCETCEWVELSYDDAELTRLHLALVTSAPGTARVELLRNVSQNLNDHELRRPLVPAVPAPVEGLGRKERVAAAEWYVARTSETESLKHLVDQVVVMVPTQTALRREPAVEVPVAS
jgi:hypothetical protein